MEMLRSLRVSLSDLLFHSCASFIFNVKLCCKLTLFFEKTVGTKNVTLPLVDFIMWPLMLYKH